MNVSSRAQLAYDQLEGDGDPVGLRNRAINAHCFVRCIDALSRFVR